MTGTQRAQERAAGFVAAHGDELARERARTLRGVSRAETALALVPLPAAGDVDALARVLALCGELRALRSPLAQRACAAAQALQGEDGSFGGACGLEQRLLATGSLGGELARSPFARPEALEAAGSFLAAHFSPDLLQGFHWERVAAYAQFFSNALHDAADEILQWCGRELERGFRARRFDALATARVLCLCDAHALPGARLEPGELLLSLLSEQRCDGSFGAVEDASGRIEGTLHGLRALALLSSAAREAPGRTLPC